MGPGENGENGKNGEKMEKMGSATIFYKIQTTLRAVFEKL